MKPKTLKLRSKLAITREYNRAHTALFKAGPGDQHYLCGAIQALAWVLNDSTLSPAKAYSPKWRKRT